MQKTSPVALELREFEPLLRIAKRLLMFKTKMRANSQGQHSSRLRGRGMIFEEVRAYSAGDDVRHIDWRVTARTNAPHTKLYSEERERAVFMLVDFRANMQFATRGAYKSVVAGRLATILGAIASKNGDRIGAMAIAGNHHAMRSSRGLGAPLALFKYLCMQHDYACNHDVSNTAHKALSQLYNLAKPGSLVFFLSDFADIDERSKKLLVDLTRHTELVLIQIYDPIEAELPSDSILRFKDKHQQVIIDTHNKAHRRAYRQNFANKQAALIEFAKRHQIHFASTSTTDEPIEQVRRQLDINNV